MKFRKKPVVIEAKQITLDSALDVAQWCLGLVKVNPLRVVIPTLEGNMIGSLEDWIIKGTAGEFYPIKPDILAQTYEKIED